MKDITAIKTFAENIGLPEEAQNVAFPLCEKIISAFAEDYEAIHQNMQRSELIFALAEKMAEGRDQVMLAVCLLLGKKTYDYYKERGISEEIPRFCCVKVHFFSVVLTYMARASRHTAG